MPVGDLLNTKEVAAYLRIKERKVYELLKDKSIPASRVTGKWLFDKDRIDEWLAAGIEGDHGDGHGAPNRPPIVAGSADPLLEWALRESGSGLALNAGGSLDGLARYRAGEAMACGMHVRADDGSYNVEVVRDAGIRGAVLIHWAQREQGVVVAPGNPKGITGIADLKTKGARMVRRQDGAGSRILFDQLVADAGMDPSDLDTVAQPAHSETELALAVSEGKADAGLCVADAARQYRLDFIALTRERYDLLVNRCEYFEPGFQALLAFTRTEAFAQRVGEMAGYDVSDLGTVVFNG